MLTGQITRLDSVWDPTGKQTFIEVTLHIVRPSFPLYNDPYGDAGHEGWKEDEATVNAHIREYESLHLGTVKLSQEVEDD